MKHTASIDHPYSHFRSSCSGHNMKIWVNGDVQNPVLMGSQSNGACRGFETQLDCIKTIESSLVLG